MVKRAGKILAVLIIFTCMAAGADDKRLALVRKIQGTEQLPETLSRQLQSLTLQVVAKQKDYELLLSGTDTPNASLVDMVAVESEIGRDGNYYSIEARLLDIRTKKLLTKASRGSVREEDLLRLFQGALESLFIPDPEKALKKKEIEPAQKTENLPRQKQKYPSTLQTNQPNLPALDFKQRVKDLKSGTDQAIAKVVEEKEQAAAVKKETKNNPSTNQPPTTLAAMKSEAFVEKKEPISKVYPRQHVLMVGYDSRQVDSDYYISTATKAQLLTMKASGHLPLSMFDGKIAGSYDLAYSRGLSAPVELPTIYQAGLSATWLGTFLKTSVGVLKDSSFFVNLPSPGEGIFPSSISSTWMRIRSEITLDFRGRWIVAASYGMPLMVETDYKPLSKAKEWKGTNLNVSITPPYSYKSWETALTVDQMNLTTQGDRPFTLNESRVALSIRRSL